MTLYLTRISSCWLVLKEQNSWLRLDPGEGVIAMLFVVKSVCYSECQITIDQICVDTQIT